MEPIEINPSLTIPVEELGFVYSRSSGPGGQHVNRVETRVTLRFDVGASQSLTETQKQRVRRELATRISREDVLSVASQRHRSREANRRAAVLRFAELLAAALKPRKKRRPTRVSKAAKQRRLDAKRQRSTLKRTRSRRDDD
jgi:ribosome-associated protein